MSCEPRRPCADDDERGLGLVPPQPGAARLRRRSGDFAAFVDDLIRETEQHRGATGRALGAEWDVEGDPRAMTLVRLWAYVAETVAAYAELTANESYLATAADWTDLRRLAALVGYRPRPGTAASGWVRFDTDRGVSPVVPAGTRVQAPGVPGVRDSQTYEVAETTQLHAEWADLVATPIPQAAAPAGNDLRFLADPGFAAGDRVLFVEETPTAGAPPLYDTWWSFWAWLLWYYAAAAPSANKPIALAVVESRERELGTSVVTFDRGLADLLVGTTAPYAAYRVVAHAGSARRITRALDLTRAAPEARPIGSLYTTSAIVNGETSASLTLDAALDDVSRGQLCAVVDWDSGRCDVVAISKHVFTDWEVAPGSTARVSRLEFARSVPALAGNGPVTAYVVERRVAARHYTIPVRVTSTPARLRLYPAPPDDLVPPRIALRSVPPGGEPVWEVFACARSADQEAASGDAPRGLYVDLLDGRRPAGDVDRQPASGNVVAVRHGTSVTSTLGSGDAVRARQVMAVPKSPVAYDIAPDGTPVSTLLVRADGLEWDEVPSLYAAGPVDAYATTLDAAGALSVRFGDGFDGNRVPTGRNNVTASYRVGGGLAGEVASGDIDSLVGSIRGVRGVGGVGPTTGGADQDDETRLRALAPSRARAFGRAVSTGDLADLALGFPGVSHAAAWRGERPPGCACGRSGLHVAFLRTAGTGVRVPEPAEVKALSDYLDARRDQTVPLCVARGVVTETAVALTVARDPRRAPEAVAGAVRALLRDADGPLAPRHRALGRALDRSDVVGVVHGVPGVVGLTASSVRRGSAAPAERLAARRWELLVVGAASTVTEVVA